MRRILVILPASTAYRAPFFELAVPALRERGYALRVAHGGVSKDFAARGDIVDAPWSCRVPVHAIPADGEPWVWRRWRAAERHPDLIVVQHAIRNVETYPILLRSRFGGAGIAMWGHGRPGTTVAGSARDTFKGWLTRQSEWFFAYTKGGAAYVTKRGFPSERVTVMNNTIDTAALRRDLARISPQDLDEFRTRHRLAAGRTALFLGGVDEQKGIGFLLEAARRTEERLPGFVLLVGGQGALESDVTAAEAGGEPVRGLGRLEGQGKALALAASDVLAVPEGVGLVAVDSLIAGRPIFTTHHPSHGVEFEYLEPGRTAVVTRHGVDEYSSALARTLNDPASLAQMGSRCLAESGRYTLDRMVEAFVQGVQSWDRVRSRRSR